MDPIKQWLETQTKGSDNMTSFRDLLKHFKSWAEDMEITYIPNIKNIKEELLSWQELSKFGLDLGTRQEPGKNGPKHNPLLNLVILEPKDLIESHKFEIAILEDKLARAVKIADLYKQICETLQTA